MIWPGATSASSPGLVCELNECCTKTCGESNSPCRLYKPARAHAQPCLHVARTGDSAVPLLKRPHAVPGCNCMGPHGIIWNAWAAVSSMCAWLQMSPCPHVIPMAGQVFPWLHGHRHSRYRTGTAVLPMWLHEGTITHGPSTRSGLQMHSDSMASSLHM